MRIQSHRHGDVGVEAFGVKPDAPAVLAIGQGLAASQHQADDQLVIEGEQIGLAVTAHTAAQLGNGLFGAAHDLGVELPQPPIDFDEALVARCVEPHQLIGSGEAAKAVGVGDGARQARGLVDDEAGQSAAIGIKLLEVSQQLIVAVTAGALGQHLLGFEEDV